MGILKTSPRFSAIRALSWLLVPGRRAPVGAFGIQFEFPFMP
jgi:hypothetical protein